MTDYTFDDENVPGYFLPEDSQRLLTQVCNHVRFLARLGQPRDADQRQAPATEIGRGEWMFCLEQLAEQLDMVLQELSWPARLATAQETVETASASLAGTVADDAAPIGADGFVYGVTMDQIDTLNRLIPAIAAYGDAVSANDMADFAKGTLVILGHAIFDRANEVADIVNQVEAQRLGKGAPLRFSVKETSAVYCIQAPFRTSEQGALSLLVQ